MSRRTMYIALIAGVGARLALAPISGHPFDMYTWYATGSTALGGSNWYGTTEFAYPPIWGTILFLLTAVYASLAPGLGATPLPMAEAQALLGTSQWFGAYWVTDWLFNLLVKAPLILGDLLLALLLAKTATVRSSRPEAGRFAFIAFFLNPFVIWISSVWGMFDVLPLFLAITGTLLLLQGRHFESGLAFGLGIGLKYFPALLLLALLVGLRRDLNRRAVAHTLAGVALVLVGISIPFLILDASVYTKGILSPASGENLGHLSLWTLLPLAGILDVPVWIGVLVLVAVVLALVSVAWVLGGHASWRDREGLAQDLVVLSLLTTYLLFRIVNEQYALWIIPLLTLDAVLGRESWKVLMGMTAIPLAYTLLSIPHISFFLPLLTVSPGLAWLVPRMWNVPILSPALGIVYWIASLVLLRRRIQRRLGAGTFFPRFWADVRKALGMAADRPGMRGSP